jgi:glycosyltransferase involved in cell wall biosynthesis
MLELLQYSFMQKALLAGSVISITCALLGVFLILRRMALIGDGFSHIAFGGVACGLFASKIFDFIEEKYAFFIALIFSVISALGIVKLREYAKVYGDVSIGIVFSFALALGVILISLAHGFSVDLHSFLFGNIISITDEDVYLAMALGGIVFVLLALYQKELMYLSFDEVSAKVAGIPVYKFIEREPAHKSRRDFTFLHYNAFNIRKGFTEVWKAFNNEFEKTEPVKLILKTDQSHSPIPIVKSEYPNIEVIYGKISEAEMFDIMKRSDCFVFPSRGEGFGMTPLETMATGMAAIIPNAHGLSEYFNADYMYEVKVKEECPALYARYKDIDVGKMFVSDVADLRKKMRWCVNHQEEVIEKGKRASEYVKQWTYKAGFAHAIERIKEIMNMDIKPAKLRNILTLEKVR